MKIKFITLFILLSVSFQVFSQNKGALVAAVRGTLLPIALLDDGLANETIGWQVELQYKIHKKIGVALSYTMVYSYSSNIAINGRYYFLGGSTGGIAATLGYMVVTGDMFEFEFSDGGYDEMYKGVTIGVAGQRAIGKRLGISFEYGYSFADTDLVGFAFENNDYGLYTNIGLTYFIIR